jgi:hypothetical protein
MASNLKIKKGLSATPQPVEDESGNPSSLALSTDKVGIGTTIPKGKLDVSGDIVLNGNTKTQLSATGDSTVLKGGLIVLDLSPVGGGQLQIGSNTNDDKIFLEGFSRDGSGHASEMLITGRFAKSLPLFTVLANVMRLLGTMQIGESLNANFTLSPSDTSPNAGYIRFGDQTGWKLHFGRSREKSVGPLNTGTTGVLMTIQDNGNVGIGTTKPEEKLHVVGNIVTTGDIRLLNADCAEEFDICDTEQVEPGTVMVLGEEGKLHPSQNVYDKCVVGVVSGAGDYKPGIVLDKQESSNTRKPIALLGKVFCKVDAGHGIIKIGDLLTTSPTPGYAMKAADPLKAFGAVIGKALRPLAEGQGLIPILIALQ